jgi:hypothetical protein
MGVEDFLDFMGETVQIAPYVATTVGGVKSYGADVPYPCRIQMGNHIVVDKSGREVTASGTIYIGSTVVPSDNDRFTLPADFPIRTPSVLAINIVYEEAAIHHIKVEIK